MKSLLENTGDFVCVLYQIAVFHKRFHRAGNIRLLEHVAADQFGVYLAGNTYQGNAVSKSRGDSCDHIGSSRAGGDGTDAHLSRDP